MEIEKGRDYKIIVFANQDYGQKAQRILVTKKVDFKHISTLAIVVPDEKCDQTCQLLNNEDVLISGHYKFLYRSYEEDFFKKAENYKPADTSGEFLESITLCYVAPCIADPDKIRFIAYFSSDISEILPYLNTVIKNAVYNKNAQTLTYTKGRRIINLYNIKITVAKADNILDAWNILNEIKNLINNTYRNRDKIKPNYEKKAGVTALQIYGWLPKSNCKLCGEATCLAFAVKMLQGEQRLKECRPLFTDSKFSENKQILMDITEAMGL